MSSSSLTTALCFCSLFLLLVSVVFADAANTNIHQHRVNSGPNNHHRGTTTYKQRQQKRSGGGIPSLHDKVKRIVVLMQENRPFDHIFGFYNRTKHGLIGREFCNVVNESLTSTNSNKKQHQKSSNNIKKVCTSDKAPYINYCDPNHSLSATTYKVFGAKAYAANNITTPTNGGFAQFEYTLDHHHDVNKTHYCGVMDAFAPGKLPVITALADNFVLFDKFHCSVPGPTWPNRMFFMSGTSGGLTETGVAWYHNHIGSLFPQKTIFDQVSEAKEDWKVYYGDTPWELFMESLAHSPENLQSMDVFHKDAREGTLPLFSWINPRGGSNLTTFEGANDQHPDHDMRLGEELYKEVYEAIRASPQWNETLLVILYDEHGGLYDHIMPHSNIPAPGDGEASFPDAGFDFTRGGIRVPMLLISPWLQKGQIVSDPDNATAEKPFENSIFETTSVIASARKILKPLADKKTPPLTDRDAWAATFEPVFDNGMTEPRTDCPMKLPKAPTPAPYPFDPTAQKTKKEVIEEEVKMPINPLQQHMMTVHHHLVHGPEREADDDQQQNDKTKKKTIAVPQYPKTQGEFQSFVKPLFEQHKAKAVQWKESKHRRGNSSKVNLTVAVIPQPLKQRLVQQWQVSFLNKTSENATGYDEQGLLGPHPRTPNRPSSTGYFQTISALYTDRATNVTTAYCIDAPEVKKFGVLGLSVCYPSPDPRHNYDASQHWAVSRTDSTIRPATDTTLCATTRVMSGSWRLTLLPCDGRVEQHFGYTLRGPGMGPSCDYYLHHGLFYGQGIDVIAVVDENQMPGSTAEDPPAPV